MRTTIDVTRSRARRDILALFFLNEDKPYYQRQIERLLGIPVGNVRREILALVSEGVLTSEAFGNLRLFRVHQAHPLYRELRGIVLKTAGIAPRLTATLSAVRGLRLAFLHGSYVHESASLKGSRWTGESDVDLVAVGELRRTVLAAAFRPIERDTQRTVNSVVYDVEEFTRKLRDRGGFLAEVLSKPILPLVGFGFTPGGRPLRFTADKLLRLIGEEKA